MIGIGVYGHEGVQAVQASDFSIPEFQNLWRLLLVHGRWSYLRIAEMILYFFFKNMLFTLPQFFYAFLNGYSAETIYEDLYVTTFNLIFTALPLLIKAILEKDVDYRSRNKNNNGKNQKVYSENPKIKAFMPVLYAENKKNLIFTPTNFAYWVFKAAIMSVALFLFAIYGLANQTNNSDGMSVGLWSMSISLYTAVILVILFATNFFINSSIGCQCETRYTYQTLERCICRMSSVSESCRILWIHTYLRYVYFIKGKLYSRNELQFSDILCIHRLLCGPRIVTGPDN